MRTNIIHSGADELVYEIRGIVSVADRLKKAGIEIIWENIGDPIAKGHDVPAWIKEIIIEHLKKDEVFGYSPTRGLEETRRFIVKQRRCEGGAQLTEEDILFFNGLGDAISVIYTHLHPQARVIGPSPAYPTHSSAEASHADAAPITYELDAACGWLPKMEDLRNHIRYNPTIAGILIINPDNPTGMVYPEKILREIVELARQYDLFVISDEVYANVAYGREKFVPLSQVVEDVPAIVMRGISKEMPWPGARCGWIEVYNAERDADFARYVKSLTDAKSLEVCATTLPQAVLPAITGCDRYKEHLRELNDFYARRARRAVELFGELSPRLKVVEPQGGFYLSAVFADGALNDRQTLPFVNEEARKIVEEAVEGVALDQRFVYYLLGYSGICVVPLSTGFNSTGHGFRMTLLERDDEKFDFICRTIIEAVKKYLK